MNIFVCHTVAQYYFAKSLSVGPVTGPSMFILEGIQFLSQARDPILEKNHKFFIETSDSSYSNHTSEQIYRHVITLLDSGEELNIYVSDIVWRSCNILFFRLSNDSRVTFHGFSDGCLTLYSRKISMRVFLRMLAKKLLYLLGLGMRYYPFLGYQDGRDRTQMREILVPPKFAKNSLNQTKKFKTVNLQCDQKYRPKDGRALFVGTSYLSENVSDEEYTHWFNLQLGTHLRDKTVIYRPHPFSKVRLIKRLLSGHIHEINAPFPAEILIPKLRVKHVYGVDSTVLFSAKSVWGEAVDCTCLLDEFYIRRHADTKFPTADELRMKHRFGISTPYFP